MNNKLFVGNLSAATTAASLQLAFAVHGPVTHANLILDHVSRRPRGFAFVTMETVAAAQTAMAALNGTELDGRTLAVSLARPREVRPQKNGLTRIYKEDAGSDDRRRRL